MKLRPTPEELRQQQAFKEAAKTAFPFERIETPGEAALATWEELRGAGRGTPVIVGPQDKLERLEESFGPAFGSPIRDVIEILDATAALVFPEDLDRRVKADMAHAQVLIQEILRKQTATTQSKQDTPVTATRGSDYIFNLLQGFTAPTPAPQDPSQPPVDISVIADWRTGKSYEKVWIALIPTEDWTTVPAYLRWGGWNECPHPEYHTSALRSWRDRFGAELVAMSFDQIDLRVRHRPADMDAARTLAQELYLYDPDIVDQGSGSTDTLAEELLTAKWWSFWWD